MIKERLLALSDQRITDEGVVVIKAQAHRSQDMNRADALQRLEEVRRWGEPIVIIPRDIYYVDDAPMSPPAV